MSNSTISRYLTTIVLLLSLCCTSMRGDNMFRRFALTDKLRDNTPLCAMRDKYGFMWVGSSIGLNCFDGNGESVYHNTTGMQYSNGTSNISLLYEHGDDIWFCSNFGIYIFNRKSNTVGRFPYKTKYGVKISSTVQKIVSASNGTIWICTQGQGLFVLNPTDGQLRQDSRHGIFFSDMVVGSDGLVYAVSLSGSVSVFHPDGSFFYSCELPKYVADKNKISMVALGQEIWFSLNTGLYSLDTRTHSVACKTLHAVPNVINCLLAGKNGTLLIGTVDGVWEYATASGMTNRLDSTSPYAYGLFDHNVNNLYWDTDGSLIVVTSSDICYLPFKSEAFDFVSLPPAMRKGSCNYVRALCPSVDKKGIWVGTDRVLGFYNTTSGELLNIPLDDNLDEITSIAVDGKLVWIGFRHSGLRVYDTSTKTVKSYTYNDKTPYSVISNDINCIYRTRSGEILILTNWGMCRFDRATERFMTFPGLSQEAVFVGIKEDRHGRLWLGTKNRGVFMRPKPDDIFYEIDLNVIGTSPVTAMCVDSKGVIWVAVQGVGVFKYDEAAAKFVSLDIPALSNKTVFFMEEDQQGKMWIGLNDVIVRVGISGNPQDTKLYSYSVNADFLPTMWSSCRLVDGRLLFGSGNGFFMFTPKEMKSDDNLINVYPLSINFPYLDNSEAELKKLGLNLLLYMQEEISLPYSDNTFTIHLSTSRYGDMPPVHYDYMLKGVDKKWVHGATLSEITYSNLSPGDYELLLRCSDGNHDKISTLRIVVLPPWYRTIWAWLVYIVLMAFVGWGIFLRSRRIIRKHYEKRVHEYKVRKESEMFKSKIQFFVDLVHEIRTPLTLMSLPMECMSEQLETGKALPVEESREHISSMKRNMDYLLGITNELLDFQKVECNGTVNLCKRCYGVNELMKEICGQFEHTMSVDGKNFSISLPNDDIFIVLDVDKIKRVLVNLIGNAMKYSKHNVSVAVKKVSEASFTIEVGDDGPGVPVAERNNIFDMYYQIGNDDVAASLGTGLGLAYAKMLVSAHGGSLTVRDNEGGGALFVLMLPIGNEKVAENGADAIAQVETSKNDEAEDALNTHNFCVLLVEDNKELLNMSAKGLGKWYKVVRAEDGVEALDLLQYHDIDLIITDVMMPRMDGVELCRRVKEDINYSHIPVVMLTAKTSNEAKVEGMENGADIYIEKPFSIRQLHLQIVNLLRMRHQFYERMQSIKGMETPEQNSGELGMNRRDINFLQKMNKYMQENISDDEFSIDTLADKMSMSRSSFYRKIKALTGMTPVDYMRNARLDYAAKLLASGERVTEVAMMVGFTSSSYFAKCFKAKFGVLPKDYASDKGN